MTRAYVAHPLDEEGSSVVHTLQPVDGLVMRSSRRHPKLWSGSDARG
jgi:hypothetical protein